MITPFIAQADFGSLKAEFIKSMLIFGAAMTMVIVAVLGLLVAWLNYRMEKKSKKEPQTQRITPQPLQISKSPKKFNYDLAKSQKEEVDRRLEDHDTEIDALWNTMRLEDEAIRKEVRDATVEQNRSLGRIEGALGIKEKE